MSGEWTERELDLKARLQRGRAVVISLRKGCDENLREWARAEGRLELVDRRTKWGNPFELDLKAADPEVERRRVCDEHERYLLGSAELLEAIPELRGKALGCWCAPEQCHADALAAFANDPLTVELCLWLNEARVESQ